MDASILGFSAQQLIALTAAFISVVAVASFLIAHRDAWLTALRSRPQLLRWTLSAIVVAALAAFAASHLDELRSLLERLERGDITWLLIAVGLEAASFAGYVVLTYLLYHRQLPRIDWPTATSLTLGGVVATRLLAAAGAGGIAFTGWVLHRAGMGTREAARRLTAFLLLLYAVYMALLLVAAIAVLAGVRSDVPRGLAVLAVLVSGGALLAGAAATYLPATLEQRAADAFGRFPRTQWLATRIATLPQVVGNGVRIAVAESRAQPSLLGWAAVWWVFDVAVLWATFHAFGEPPDLLVLVVAYFLGMLGNLLPLPGGVGGTEGGMTAVLVASGVELELALASVVAYKVISSYLPAIPGIAAYAHLRRRMAAWGEPGPEGEVEAGDDDGPGSGPHDAGSSPPDPAPQSGALA